MASPDKVLLEYRITEKSTLLTSNVNQYTFEVARQASRTEVARAVEAAFGVKVAKVNTLNKKAKRVRNRTDRSSFGLKPSFKKAIVTLKEGDKIELV